MPTHTVCSNSDEESLGDYGDTYMIPDSQEYQGYSMNLLGQERRENADIDQFSRVEDIVILEEAPQVQRKREERKQAKRQELAQREEKKAKERLVAERSAQFLRDAATEKARQLEAAEMERKKKNERERAADAARKEAVKEKTEELKAIERERIRRNARKRAEEFEKETLEMEAAEREKVEITKREAMADVSFFTSFIPVILIRN